MKRLIIFLLLFAAIKVAGQTTGYLRFDTVLIYKQGGTAELILRSSTKDSLGVLVNYSDGRTRFMKSRALNDSTIIIGLDTIVIRGATGGTSGGTGIGEVVGGYGLINVNDSTLRVDTTQIPTQFDISTKVNYSDTASMLSPYLRKVDTTNKWLGIDTRFVDTLYRVNDSTVGFTIRGDAYTIEVKGGVNGGGGGSGTVTSISQGYGIINTPNPITTTGTIDVDSAALSSYYLRRKDSTTDYVTPHDLTQLPVPTLQQVTDAGQVTNDSVKVRTVSIDSALYMAVRSASDSINLAQKAGLIVYDSVSGSFMYRNQNLWTFLSSLSNSLIPNRPNMRLIASVIRPVVDGTTVTWQHIVDPLHDSVGFAPLTCDGSSINLNLTSEAAKIITIQAQPDETLAQYIDCGVSFQTTHARLYLKRRIGMISGYFQGNGTTYVWTGTGGVTFTYNTANGQLNFDFNSDYTPSSNGTSVTYRGTNGYGLERLFAGLSGNDRGYQVVDAFGNGVVGAPTSADVIEIVVPEQIKPATINPCTAGGDGWAAYVFGGGLANIWIIGLVEY